MMEDKFYMVFVTGKGVPNKLHSTLEEAEQEAVRLAQKELAKTYVLQTVCKFELKVVDKTIIE